jgi:hypothetical protein
MTHLFKQALPDSIRDLDKDFTEGIDISGLPNQYTFILGYAFKQIGNIRRMESVDQLLYS